MPESTLKTSIVIGASLDSTFKGTFQSAEQHSKRLGDTLKKATLGASISGEVVSLRKELTSLQRRQKRVGDSTGQLGREIQRVKRRYEEAKRGAREYGVKVGDAARQHRRFAQTARQAEQALGRLQRRQERRAQRQQLHSRALPLLGAGYAVGRAFSGAMDVEQAQVRLRTVLDSEDVGKSLEESRRHAIKFARRNLTTETEILDIEYALNSAGLGEQLSRAGSEVVAKLATVTKGAPELVGEVVATTMRNLGDRLEGSTKERFSRVGDLLAKTQFKFQIRDFGQLGESMKMAAPELSKYNVALEQGVTLIGALNSAGLQGTMAGTALGASFRRLSKASREFGFELARDEKGQLDFIQTLRNLREAVGGSFDGLDQDVLDKLDRAFEAEGSRAIILLGKQLEQLGAAQEDVAEGSKGIVNESYRHFLESTPGKMKIFRNNVRLVGTTFAGTLLPALNLVLQPFTRLAAWTGGLIERFPALGIVIGGATVGLVGLIGILWLTKYAVSVVGDAWDMGKGAVSGLGNAVKWARARLVAFNATALVTAARTKALAVGGAIKTFGSSLMGLARVAVPMVLGSLKALSLFMLTNPIGLAITGIAVAAVLIWKYWEPIKGFFKGVWEGVKTYTAAFWEWLKSTASAVWEGIKYLFLNFHPLGILISNWEPVKGFFKGLWTGVKTAFSTAWASIKDWWKSFSFLEFGKNLMRTLADGILAAPGAVWNALKSTLGAVGRLLPSSDAREGPLSRLTASGRSILESLGQGVRQVGAAPLRRPLARALGTAAAGLALSLPVSLATPALTPPAIAAPKVEPPSFPAPAAPGPAAPVSVSPVVKLPSIATPKVEPPSFPAPAAPGPAAPVSVSPVVKLPSIATPKVEPPSFPAPAAPGPAAPVSVSPVVKLPSIATPKVEPPSFPAPAAPGPAAPVSVEAPALSPASGQQALGPNRSVVVNNHYRITISQQPGEDAKALADRIISEIEQRQGRSRREELFDEVGD